MINNSIIKRDFNDAENENRPVCTGNKQRFDHEQTQGGARGQAHDDESRLACGCD